MGEADFATRLNGYSVRAGYSLVPLVPDMRFCRANQSDVPVMRVLSMVRVGTVVLFVTDCTAVGVVGANRILRKW